MHSIKIIRDNIDLFQKKIKERNVSVNFDKLIILDKKYRETIQRKKNLKMKKNQFHSREIKNNFQNLKICPKKLMNSQKNKQI